jgi:hypothetical protein
VDIRTRLDTWLDAGEDRETWMWAGSVAQWLCVLSAYGYMWLHGPTFARFGVALAACAVCQVFVVAVVCGPVATRVRRTWSSVTNS